MTRTLSTIIPPAIHAAVEGVIAKTADNDRKRELANETYRSAAFRHHAYEAHKRIGLDALQAMAQALVDWGAKVRSDLPLRGWIMNRSQSPDGRYHGLPVIHHEIAFAEREGFPGGQLTTDLELELDETEGDLFRYHARFNGFRVTGGGVLSTASGLYMTLHPEALVQIHQQIAEGHAWVIIERSLDRLVEAYKDR